MTWSAVALYRFPFPSRPGFQRSAEPQLGAMLLVRAYPTPSTPGSVGIPSGVCLGSTPRNRDVIRGPERRRSAELPLGAIRNSRNAPSRGSALRFMESSFLATPGWRTQSLGDGTEASSYRLESFGEVARLLELAGTALVFFSLNAERRNQCRLRPCTMSSESTTNLDRPLRMLVFMST